MAFVLKFLIFLFYFYSCCCELGFTQTASVDNVNCSQFPNPISPEKCCNYPNIFKPNALEYCADKSKKGSACFYECVFAATEICRKGECDTRKVVDYFDWSKQEDDPFREIYKTTFNYCIQKTNEIRKNLVQQLNRRYNCDTIPEMIYLCVKNELFTHCPEQNWVNNDDCNYKRDFITKCTKSS